MASGWREHQQRRKRRGLPPAKGGGYKQYAKHQPRKLAKLYAHAYKVREDARQQLNTLLAPTDYNVAQLNTFGSSMPMIADGVLSTGEAFTWRFRFDTAFLEVGTMSPDGVIVAAVACASTANVTGEPYQGFLPRPRALQLMASMFADLHSPVKGELFAERLEASVNALACS